jgi:hypothetical protein
MKSGGKSGMFGIGQALAGAAAARFSHATAWRGPPYDLATKLHIGQQIQGGLYRRILAAISPAHNPKRPILKGLGRPPGLRHFAFF